MTRFRVTWAALFALGLTAGAQAGGLIGVTSFSSSVFDVDEGSGAATLITPITGVTTSLIGAEILRGELYVSDVFGGSQFLGKVDLDTGAFTGVSDQGGDVNYHGLAGNESANILYSYSLNLLQLVTVDPGDGSVTPIGSSTGQFMRGMAYDDVNGILYGAESGSNNLVTIDTTTGAITTIGATGLDHGQIGLAVDDATGTIYATATGTGPGYSLYTLDPGTGASTLIGSTGVDTLDGLTFRDQIPTPGSFAVLALGGLFVSRRRR